MKITFDGSVSLIYFCITNGLKCKHLKHHYFILRFFEVILLSASSENSLWHTWIRRNARFLQRCGLERSNPFLICGKCVSSPAPVSKSQKDVAWREREREDWASFDACCEILKSHFAFCDGKWLFESKGQILWWQFLPLSMLFRNKLSILLFKDCKVQDFTVALQPK